MQMAAHGVVLFWKAEKPFYGRFITRVSTDGTELRADTATGIQCLQTCEEGEKREDQDSVVVL